MLSDYLPVATQASVRSDASLLRKSNGFVRWPDPSKQPFRGRDCCDDFIMMKATVSQKGVLCMSRFTKLVGTTVPLLLTTVFTAPVWASQAANSDRQISTPQAMTSVRAAFVVADRFDNQPNYSRRNDGQQGRFENQPNDNRRNNEQQGCFGNQPNEDRRNNEQQGCFGGRFQL